jgi:predicted metal-dependent phosphotriesterase family hydrolase
LIKICNVFGEVVNAMAGEEIGGLVDTGIKEGTNGLLSRYKDLTPEEARSLTIGTAEIRCKKIRKML